MVQGGELFRCGPHFDRNGRVFVVAFQESSGRLEGRSDGYRMEIGKGDGPVELPTKISSFSYYLKNPKPKDPPPSHKLAKNVSRPIDNPYSRQ